MTSSLRSQNTLCSEIYVKFMYKKRVPYKTLCHFHRMDLLESLLPISYTQNNFVLQIKLTERINQSSMSVWIKKNTKK